MGFLRNLLFFSKKDAQLSKRVKRDYIEDNIAVISCNVSGIDDIISTYSVKGYETLNSEFTDYIEKTADFIPAGYPIVLDITGCEFSEDEKENITETIKDHFAYKLGNAQFYLLRGRLLFIVTLISMLAAAFIMTRFVDAGSMWHEYIYLAFWFFADAVYRFILGGDFSSRSERIRAGRLESVQVRFFTDFDSEPYSKEEREAIVDKMMSEGGPI